MIKISLFFKLGLLFCTLFCTSSAFSQIASPPKSLRTGQVLDSDGLPVIGATIAIKGTSIGTIADVDGNFSLNAADNDILIVSYIGMNSLERAASDILNFTLSTDAISLKDVILIGYSTQNKGDITGAVQSVKMDNIESRRVGDLAQALQGALAGVSVTQSTGSPGDEISILIRGEGTIGNNSPLYVIDGVPSRSISFLQPSDILSMTVLKDAASAAIYGSRASAGVVIITTKGGKKESRDIDVSYYYGLQKAVNLPKMLNTEQYLNLQETAWNNSNRTGDNPYTLDRGRADFSNTDWLGELFNLGETHNAQATISGGGKNVTYLVSAGYLTQNGVVKYNNDEYKRFNFRSNIQSNITDRLIIGANVQLTYAIQDKLNSSGDAPGIIRHAFLRPPVLGVYKDPSDPTYNPNSPFTDLPFYKHSDKNNGGYEYQNYEMTQNPIAIAYHTSDTRSHFKTFGNVFAEYSLLKDKSLKIKTNLGIDLNFYHNKKFNSNYGDDDGQGDAIYSGLGRHNRPNSLSEDRGEDLTVTWSNTINYQKSFKDHNFSVVGGIEIITSKSSSIGATRQQYDFVSPAFQYLDFGGTERGLWNGGSASHWSLFSAFASVSYNYKSKYLISATVRADGSSKFGPNNRFGYFPSVSAGWNISKEDFLKDVKWLSDLKIRGSWGQSGNQEIPSNVYENVYQKVGDSYLIKRYGNPNVKWETSEQLNIGIDAGFFDNKLYFTADYYIKTTKDILLPVPLPSIVGNVEPSIVNSGAVKNSGIELSVNHSNTFGKFSYNINANCALMNNVVTKLHPSIASIDNGVTRTKVGQPLGSYYGMVFDGIYQNTQEIIDHQHGVASPNSKPGDMKFKDLNGDGLINDNDRDFLGSSLPKMVYGITLSASYYNFDLSILFQGVQGVKRYNDLRKILNYDSRPFNSTTEALNYWRGEGSTNKYPRATFEDNGGSKTSSAFVEDASYFRLKNIELGYDFAGLMKNSKIKIPQLRVYISAQNLLTVTKYSGLEPETTDALDMGTYPQSMNFIFGITAKF